MKKILNIPKFNNAQEERRFWEKLSLDKYFEVEDFEKVSFPNLKPSTRPNPSPATTPTNVNCASILALLTQIALAYIWRMC